MGNLTQEYGAIKSNVPPAPLEGYRVVVFEKKHGGAQFKAILNPGDNPLKEKSWLFNSTPGYLCWAVSAHPDLNFNFDIQMTLANQYQDFSLNCMVYYHISSPKKITESIESDPLQKIKEEIIRRLQLNVLASKITIDDIQKRFFNIRDQILPYPTLNQLRDSAEVYGIVLKEINMTYKIPDKYLDPHRKLEEYELEKKTAFIEKDKKRISQEGEIDDLEHEGKKKEIVNEQETQNTRHQEHRENLKRFYQFQREIADHLRAGLEKIINPIDNPESFKKAFDTALDAVKRVVGEIQSPGYTHSEKQLTGSNHTHGILIPPDSAPVDDASQNLSAIRSLIENASIPTDEKKYILSILHHLQVEIQLGERADQEMIEKSIEKFYNYINTYSTILPHQILESMRRFKEVVNRLVCRSIHSPNITADSAKNAPKI